MTDTTTNSGISKDLQGILSMLVYDDECSKTVETARQHLLKNARPEDIIRLCDVALELQEGITHHGDAQLLHSVNSTMTQRDVQIHLFKGIAYRRQKHYEKGIAEFDKVLEIDPQHAPSHFFKGYSHHKMRQYKKAIHSYDIALTINPQDAAIHSLKSDAFYMSANYKKAIHSCQATLTIEPEDTNAHHTMGKCLTATSEFNEARQYLNFALLLAEDQELDKDIEAIEDSLQDLRQAVKSAKIEAAVIATPAPAP